LHEQIVNRATAVDLVKTHRTGHTCGRPEKTRQLDEQSFFAIEARIVAWFESHTIVPIQLIKSVTLN
jgi:hypothetical protein